LRTNKQQDDRFVIDPAKCDVCGNGYTVCPNGAVEKVLEAPRD